MKKLLLLILISIYVNGCATNSHSPVRSENTFNLNGKNISVTDEMLGELRKKWQGKSAYIVTSTLMNKSDVRWTLDYISLLEIIYSKGCEKLTLKETRKFKPSTDEILESQNIEAGKFDYAWVVNACNQTHIYRVVNKRGSQNFIVYPTKL